jgi:hypothetical protein
MVDIEFKSSNELFETLSTWNDILKDHEHELDGFDQ